MPWMVDSPVCKLHAGKSPACSSWERAHPPAPCHSPRTDCSLSMDHPFPYLSGWCSDSSFLADFPGSHQSGCWSSMWFSARRKVSSPAEKPCQPPPFTLHQPQGWSWPHLRLGDHPQSSFSGAGKPIWPSLPSWDLFWGLWDLPSTSKHVIVTPCKGTREIRRPFPRVQLMNSSSLTLP